MPISHFKVSHADIYNPVESFNGSHWRNAKGRGECHVRRSSGVLLADGVDSECNTCGSFKLTTELTAEVIWKARQCPVRARIRLRKILVCD